LEAEGAFVAGGTQVALMGSRGLLHTDLPELADDQRPHAIDSAAIRALGLDDASATDPVEVARALEATVLIGTTGSHGAFGEELVRTLARHSAAPVVMPLSNPTDKAEARADDILRWTDGRALVATGSPVANVEMDGRRWTIGQANNVFIFPGVGMGALVASAREVTDDVFMVAAHELAEMVSDERLSSGALYPPISELLAAAKAVAVRVVRELRDSGYGRQLRDDEIAAQVEAAMWLPAYVPYEG
jgi:malic enzyme